MKTQNIPSYPKGHSTKAVPYTGHNDPLYLHHWLECNAKFSVIIGTPMKHLKSPISKVASALRVRSEGMGLRATGRVLKMHKITVST
ncbi:MAG: hypothetical protein OEM02_05630 [Desulfobulbaceae bacterium]|nr:hypothetical protein [Desulfobulbaceae bacterium]